VIYTCTSNPSLDYSLHLNEELSYSKTNRTDKENYTPGGKGVNISIALNSLGIPNTALGFLGGFVREYYLDLLSEYSHLQPLFTRIKECSRINIKLVDTTNEYGINAYGPRVSEEEFQQFSSLLNRVYPHDYFILAGNIQDELKEKMNNLLLDLSKEGVKVIVDSDDDYFSECDPFLLYIGENDPAPYLEKGINTLANDKTYIYLKSKQEKYRAKRLDHSLGVVGERDAFTAGFVYASQRGGNLKESFAYGLASTRLLNESKSLAKLDRDLLEKYCKEVEIDEID